MRLLEFTADVNTVDQGEYDREGDMAIGQLNTIDDAADELRSILSADDNLPEWVQNKITKAVDYIDTARDYMKSKEQGVAEGSLEEIDRRGFLKGAGAAAVAGAAGGAKAAQDIGEEGQRKVMDMMGLWYACQNYTNTKYTVSPDICQNAKQSINKFIRNFAGGKEYLNGWYATMHDFEKQEIAKGKLSALTSNVLRDPNYAKQIIRNFDSLSAFDESVNQGVAEANGRRYSSYNDELSSRERDEQNYMDQSKSDFKRAEMQHELGHEDDPNFERNLRQQQLERDQGPWYIRIDGKIYRQSGQPKSFDLKNGANNYALAMIKNNPSLQGKVTLSKSEADR